MSINDLWSLLLPLVAVFAFAAGAIAAHQVGQALTKRRDRDRARERAVLNAIWARLGRDFGIDRATWLAAHRRRSEISQRPAAKR
ncbi:hypothetical protein [Actinokineospora sp. UTMC 2448]|uniref:hypothetical protein n=1 Tax=Actinokineospora sp. UTMC 2448 TaxID=2268449 RepID=UPI0021643329|nr:hypothetical protein [Actinokineospora sp. UTMC 2448]UVS81428.1 hypothetical protein Actkin_05186 [Actinokineospora sp. UTMC 2448]